MELEAVCADHCALAGGGTTFWIEDLNGVVLSPAPTSSRPALESHEQDRDEEQNKDCSFAEQREYDIDHR
jgi:hypothetical protein